MFCIMTTKYGYMLTVCMLPCASWGGIISRHGDYLRKNMKHEGERGLNREASPGRTVWPQAQTLIDGSVTDVTKEKKRKQRTNAMF